jgi:hypothetical protein
MTRLSTKLLARIKEETTEYGLLKKQIDTLTKRASLIKSDLMEVVEKYGETDSKGHQFLDLPEVVGGYVRLQRQRRVSQGVDEERAAEILKERNLSERCYKMIPVLDEDEILACHYLGLLSQEDLDEMFPKKITYAFVPEKG